MSEQDIFRVSRREFLGGLAAAGAVLASRNSLALAFTQPKLAGTIKIGMLLPFTGPFAVIAQDHTRGSLLYLKRAGGTLNGMNVQFVREDDQGDPNIGLQKAQKLVESAKVDITVGVVSSAVALAVRDYFDRAKQILVITVASANAITRQKSPYIFRISVGAWQNSYPLGAWAYKNVGKTAVTLAPDYAMGKEFTSGFEEAFTKPGGKVIDRLFPRLGTTDFAPYLSAVRASGAELAWATFAGSDAANFVKQYAQFGLKERVPLVGVGHMTSNDVLPAEGKAALGIRTNYHYAPALDNPVNRAFVAAYRKEYNAPPSPFAMYGYDAIQVVHRALLATGGAKSVDKLVRALEQVKFDSPRGPIRIDPQTHNVALRQYLLEVRETPQGLDNTPLLVLGTFTDRAQIG